MQILYRLESYDGKTVSTLETIYRNYLHDAEALEELVSLVAHPATNVQTGATWLLKKCLQQGLVLAPELQQRLLDQLQNIACWQSRLHLCQALPHLHLQPGQKRTVETFYQECLTEKNKFVRAWAYNGLYALAKIFPENLPATIELLNEAYRNESAAVRARIRNLIQEDFS